jgi:predicted ester cyclase
MDNRRLDRIAKCLTTPESSRRRLARLIGGVAASLLVLSLAVGLSPTGAADHATTPDTGPDTAQTDCPATTEAERLAIARAWHEEVINQRNPAVLQDILAPHVVHHAAGGYPSVQSAADVAAMMDDFLVAFSPLHYNFDLLIVRDDYVVQRYTATGTHTGPFGRLPPSGRTATWTGINIFRIECGRIAEVWSEVDALSRTQQLTGAATPNPAP